MNYQEAIEKVRSEALPGIGSRLACRPLVWREQPNPRITPHLGYLALFPRNGPNEWFLMGIGDPIRAKFTPEEWLRLTKDGQEWEVIPFPLEKSR